MSLPNYFLADLPPEATLSPAMILEAAQTLKRNRAQYLAQRSTASLVHLFCDVAQSWLKPDNPFRRLALENPQHTGFGRATLEKGLDQFFRQFTPENFQELLVQELGDANRLDRFVENRQAGRANRLALAAGPELLVHIASGNIPNPALMSLTLGLLTRSAQFVKCATGAAFLPRLFAHSLYDADPKLGACVEIAEWRGGRVDLENAVFAEADCVTATGSDETLTAIRRRLPDRTRLVGYGHRLSFGFIAGEMLAGSWAGRIVARAAEDVVAWNQRGCLSPHVIYVQTGGELSPERFAERLAQELERREAAEPRGELPPETAAAIASRRSIYEVRAAHSPETTQHWRSAGSTAWTVVFETDPRFQSSCLNRFIYVKPVRDLAEALQNADLSPGRISTVGLAAPEHRQEELALQLARRGVTRVCPLGRMQDPPLAWRHDGRPALGDLVTWTDWET